MTIIVMDNDTFESHKLVQRSPMTRLAYNKYRGWDLPDDEDGSDEGYLVEYLDGGKPNDKRHQGYISWSPKQQFDFGYTVKVEQNKVEFTHIASLVKQLKFRFHRVGYTTVTGCWAFLTLSNGKEFQVGYGESACVDPKNYNSADGEKYAKERCVVAANNKLWEMEGYLLAVTGKSSDKH